MMRGNAGKKIVVCLAVVLLSSGIYYYRELDSFMKIPDVFNQKQSAGISAANKQIGKDAQESPVSQSGQSTAAGQSRSKSGETATDAGKAVESNLTADLEQKAGRPISKIDILKSSLILIRKLSPEDIQYLRQAAQKDKYTSEDYQRSREILKKLSPEDISMLQEIGKKYGKDLSFMNQT